MKVAPGISIVASGTLGFDLTDPFDCTVWMLDSGPGGFVLFDAGAGLDVDGLVAQARADGVEPEAIRTIILTHAHADHSGGLAPLKSRLGARVLAGAATADMLAAGDEERVSLPKARRAGFYPESYVWRPAPADQVLADGEVVEIGRLSIKAVATPGHSGDHMSYLVTSGEQRMLIAGDAVFYGGKVSLQDIYDCNVAQVCDSIRRLSAEDFDVFLPAHGLFSLRAGKRHVDRARAVVDGMLPPGSLFA